MQNSNEYPVGHSVSSSRLNAFIHKTVFLQLFFHCYMTKIQCGKKSLGDSTILKNWENVRNDVCHVFTFALNPFESDQRVQQLSTHPNFRGCLRELLSPGQTIATWPRNISQHCWAQHVACVWSTCCDVLRHVECCRLKFDHFQTCESDSSLFTRLRSAGSLCTWYSLIAARAFATKCEPARRPASKW